MNKKTLFKEIHKELGKLNNQIDTNIIKGRPYAKEAQRHKKLLATLHRLNKESQQPAKTKRFKLKKSPVHRRLEKGVASRFIPWKFA